MNPDVPTPTFKRTTFASVDDVRALLCDMATALAGSGIPDSTCGDVLIAVGEILNNVAEHAYDISAPGPVRLWIDIQSDRIICKIQDCGQPLPADVLERAELPSNSGPVDSLPEGGFGWFLIHQLTTRLSYHRSHDVNFLSAEFVY